MIDVMSPLTIKQEYAPIAVSNAKSYKTYRAELRRIVRGFWSGVIDFDQAFEAMLAAIRIELTKAWESGAKEMGITPSELTEAELEALNERIFEENNRISPFLEAIEENSKANGGQLAPFYSRVELWANRWIDVQNQAKTMAQADAKLEWVLGHAEKHCLSCLKLNGKVKRASYWEQLGLRPQNPPNPFLSCGGWECDCQLRKTDRPVSRGPLPMVH